VPEPVSVVATLFNEGRDVEDLVRSLLAQTRPPDEIVVVDGGSTDGSAEVLDRLADDEPRLRVIHRRCGRSAGRNIAIAEAAHDVIACIDGGCLPEPDWLERLVEPFDRHPDTTWVAGFYRPSGATVRSTSIGLVMVYVLDEVDPATFQPSGRSQAFRRPAWRQAGGFPEELDFAEDTVFDERMAAAGHRPVFAGDAVVRWRPPPGYAALARTMFRWGRGDGLARIRGYTYKRILALYGGTAAGLLAGLVVRPRLAPLALLPLAAATVRTTRRKYRWAQGATRFVHIPAAHVVGTAMSLAGFLAGAAEARRPARRAVDPVSEQ
jgi:glycosyltransferase involved in cell wall biosynthesis